MFLVSSTTRPWRWAWVGSVAPSTSTRSPISSCFRRFNVTPPGLGSPCPGGLPAPACGARLAARCGLPWPCPRRRIGSSGSVQVHQCRCPRCPAPRRSSSSCRTGACHGSRESTAAPSRPPRTHKARPGGRTSRRSPSGRLLRFGFRGGRPLRSPESLFFAHDRQDAGDVLPQGADLSGVRRGAAHRGDAPFVHELVLELREPLRDRLHVHRADLLRPEERHLRFVASFGAEIDVDPEVLDYLRDLLQTFRCDLALL